MNPISTPVTPSIPAETQYPASKLNLFTEYNRASYAAAFGDPDTFDASKPEKRWFDTTVPDSGTASYHYLAIDGGKVVTKTLTLTGEQARTVNLFGIHTYPHYQPAPTQATKGGQPIDPYLLTTPLEANQLAWEIDARDQVVIEDSSQDFMGGVFYPADEQRRLCSINFKGNPMNAGLLYKMKYANGVGSAGVWDIAGVNPIWKSSLPMNLQPPTVAPVPIPQRPLDASEKTQVSFAGLGFVIYRDGSGIGESAGSGGLTAEQDRKLSAIYAEVVKP